MRNFRSPKEFPHVGRLAIGNLMCAARNYAAIQVQHKAYKLMKILLTNVSRSIPTCKIF